MAKIHQLSAQVISQIAAGEVIERPVYAVKELVENSLDAGADSITIQIEDAGLKKIAVTDNGEGMSKEDLLLSFKPHTTSKISNDLIGIQTLGFRGEALSSIASIADLSIQSKTSGSAAGNQIRIFHGDAQDIMPIGMPVGTTVSVAHLFANVPARKKFLKSSRTEFRHTVDLITQYALVYPKIRFLLLHNKKVVLDLPKDQTVEERLNKLLGATTFMHLLPIIDEPSFLEIHGFVARPQIATRTLTKQYLFVNGRVVSDRMITTAVKEAYGNLLDGTHFPVYVLYLNLPAEGVDVNVHPRKEQVNFVSRTAVLDAVKAAVSKTLMENDLTFGSISFSSFSTRTGSTQTYAADVLREDVSPWTVKDAAHILKNSDIIQIHNTYLLAQTARGLVLIDQHAAHERILYEQFATELQIQKKKMRIFHLAKPMVLDLSPTDSEGVTEHIDSFKALGFEIEHFSENAYRLNCVPELLKDRDITSLILELIEQFDSGKKVTTDFYSEKMLSFLACRSAVMAGERLTENEARRLIEKLEDTPNNATCPHGRPTKIEVTKDALDKMFKRA